MKKFTLFAIVCVLSLSLPGQSIERQKNSSENWKAMEERVSERLIEATERLFNPGIQSLFISDKTTKANYVLKTDSLIDRFWDDHDEEWVNDWKNTFVYNEAWQATIIHEEAWDEDEHIWETVGRMELSYNELGQVTVLEVYSDDDEEWKTLYPLFKMEVTYDGNNRIDYIEVFDYEDGEWAAMMIQDYSFSEELLVKIETQIYDEEDEEWVQAGTIHFSYDDAGRRTKSEMYMDFGEPLGEIMTQRIEYSYNADGQLIETIESEFNIVVSELVPEYKREYYYDQEGLPDEVLDYFWDGDEWLLSYKQTFVFDSDVNLSDVAYPFLAVAMLFEWELEAEVDPHIQKLPLEITEYEYYDADFHKDYHTAFFYSPTDDTVEEYTITATAGDGGSISPEGEITVMEGDDQAFAIEADDGYQIEDVLVDDASAGAVDSYTFEDVSSNHTIHATFVATVEEYTITATAGDGGSISPEGEITVMEGDDQAFAIEADDGYQIEDVLVDDASVGAVDSYTFEDVSSNHTIHATFVADDVAVDEVPESLELFLYPNPADNYVSIEASINMNEVRLYDILGQVVYNAAVGDTNYKITLDGLKTGIYFLQVSTADGVTTKRLQVSR